MNKIIGKTDAKPRAGETCKDDNVIVRSQNIDLADQGKAPDQKQNTSIDGKKMRQLHRKEKDDQKPEFMRPQRGCGGINVFSGIASPPLTKTPGCCPGVLVGAVIHAGYS